MRITQRLTLSDGVQEFFKKLKRQDLSPITLRGYQSDVDLFKRWAEELATARRALKSYIQTKGSLKKSDPIFSSSRGDAISVRSIQPKINKI